MTRKKIFFIFILILIFLIFSNFLKAQNDIPMCTSPQNLVIWPNMTNYTIPMAVSSGILGSSPIIYSRSSPTQFIHLGNSVTVRSNGGDNRDQLSSSTGLWVKWGGIYTSGPKRYYHSGGSISFMDDSTSTDNYKKFYNTFYIEQYPSYMYWEDNRRYHNEGKYAYGNLRFSYSEYNPTNATITGRLGDIPPRGIKYNSNLMTLTWDGKLLIGGTGTATPTETLDVRGNILSSATITAQRFCLGNDCRNTWPSGGASYWTLYSNNLYATPTNVNVGIGTTNPTAKLHIVSNSLPANFEKTGEGGEVVGFIKSFSSDNNEDPYISFYKQTNSRRNALRYGFIQAGQNGLIISPANNTGKVLIAPYNRAGYNASVGIGTTNPTAKLHVVGDILSSVSSTLPANFEKTGEGGEVVRFVKSYFPNNNEDPYISFYKQTADESDALRYGFIQAGQNGLIISPANNTGKVLIAPYNRAGYNASVGIGTTNPTAKLHVVGDILSSATITAQRFCLGNDCRNTWPSGGASYWTLYSNNLYATPTNVNVGIGTTNPTEKLEVAGNIKATGFISSNSLLSSGGTLRVNYDANLAINGGNVGIGTNTPTAKLHINGNTRIYSSDGSRLLLEVTEE